MDYMQKPPITYISQWVPLSEADNLFQQLSTQINWQQESIIMYGKKVTVPRLVAWYGDENASYRYSGVLHKPMPWLPLLNNLKQSLAREISGPFNSVLCNYYRDGHDYMGWHSDDESELGIDPVIASISLGAERDFYFRHKETKMKYDIHLTHGSLLIMNSGCQQTWQHSLPKRLRCRQPRINLTFRNIFNLD